MQSSILLLFACCVTVIYALDNATSCSAINAYVHITSLPHTHLNGTTLLSSHALFAPHTYYVPSTPFVSLDPTKDDICNASGISTNISTKIVLLFESQGNCSVRYRVNVAQQNGAQAVLMANNEPTDEVVPVADSNSPLKTSIPMRSISLEDGETLLTQIELANAQIFGEFGCFDSEYSASLCLVDSFGDYWYADGEYQRMAEHTVNGHPVWVKDGISQSIAKLYIYLSVGTNNGDVWLWVISYDPFFKYEEDIRLKCSTSVHDPSLCTQWFGINDPYTFFKTKQSHFCSHYGKKWHCNKIENTTFTSAPEITLSDSFCAADTSASSRLCITSETKLLTPFMGEYYQYNAAKAIWMRELNECDQKPAMLLFDGVGFALLDPLNRDFIASCFLEASLLNTSQLDPSACAEWKSIHDHSYNEDNLLHNDLFTVTMGACAAARATCEATQAPDAFCMTSNTLLNGIMSGTFLKTNITGPEYGSPQYKRSKPMIHEHNGQQEEVDVYVWYRNEIIPSRYTPQYEDYPDYRNWVLVGRSLTESLQPYDESSSKRGKGGKGGRLRIYGICDGFAFGNPLNCKHWSFKTQRTQYLRDDKVEMFSIDDDTTCDDNIAPVAPSSWPQYICVGLKDEGAAFGGTYSKIDPNFFIGGYEVSEEKGSEAWSVKWIKRVNDNWDFEVFIDYDMDRGTWELEGIWNESEWKGFGDSKYHKRDFYRKYKYDFKCDAWKHEVLNPVICEIWYDEDYELLDNMYLYECDAEDIITLSPTTEPSVSPTAATTATPTCADDVYVIATNEDEQAAKYAKEGKGNNASGAIAVGVILCVLGTICIVISIWLWYKGRDNNYKAKRGKVISMNDDEMEIATQKDTKYDMSPLNTADGEDVLPQ